MREHLGSVTRARGLPHARGADRALRGAHGPLDERPALVHDARAVEVIVFMEGNYKRAVAGTTDDPYLKQFGEGVLELARQAEAVAHGG